MPEDRPESRDPETHASLAASPSSWQIFAAITTFSVAVQLSVWAVLWELFGVLAVGYNFFDLTDIGVTYHEYALKMAAGLIPFRDFFIEYPPLFVPLIPAAGSPTSLTGFEMRFAAMMVAFMLAAGAVTSLAAANGTNPRRPYIVAGVFSALVLVLGPISANRYDAVVAFMLAVALLFMVRGGWEAAAVALGLGFALKITPAMLLPVVLMLAPPRRALRALAGFAVAAVIPFAWVLALGGKSGPALGQMLGYHLSRPLEIESVLATPLWIARLGGTRLHVEFAAGSQVIDSGLANALATGSAVVLLAALGAAFWLVWRRRRAIQAEPRLIALAVLATMLGSLVGSKVLSPQYFVWIIPAVALVAIDRPVLGGLLGGAMLLTQIEFPANYWAFALHQQPGPIAIVIARNLVLVAAFALSLWHLWRLPQARRADPDARQRPLWLLPSGPDQVRDIPPSEPARRARKARMPSIRRD